MGSPLLRASLSSKQWERLGQINSRLSDEYDTRGHMLLKRLDVTIKSFLWNDKVQVSRRQSAAANTLTAAAGLTVIKTVSDWMNLSQTSQHLSSCQRNVSLSQVASCSWYCPFMVFYSFHRAFGWFYQEKQDEAARSYQPHRNSLRSRSTVTLAHLLAARDSLLVLEKTNSNRTGMETPVNKVIIGNVSSATANPLPALSYLRSVTCAQLPALYSLVLMVDQI